MKKQNQLNITFSVVRVFALISIVCAHISFENPYIISKMINALGSIGVTIFIILSGYFYHTDKYKNILYMIKDKLKTIVIPWVFMGSIIFLYNSILSSKTIGIMNWILWIMGYKTFLYYLPVLMVCYLIFFKRNKITMYTSIVLNILSVYFTAFGKLNVEAIHITDYLNIFNWLGYFSIGLLMQEVSADKILTFLEKARIPSIIISVVLYCLICVFDIPTGYFSYIGMPYQLIFAIALASISATQVFDTVCIHTVSNMSFGVYLLHMVIIGLTDNLYGRFEITKLFSPIIVIAISLILLYIGYFIASKIRLDNLYCMLTGIRMKRNIKEK